MAAADWSTGRDDTVNDVKSVNMEELNMKILFINGSPNKKGNTAALAEALL